MNSPSEEPLPIGACLVNNTVRASADSPDNTSGELIVYQGTQFTSPSGTIYTLVDKIGEGNFGNVYEVSVNTENGSNQSFAMKISKSERFSLDTFTYEISVLQYVCTFLFTIK